MEAFPLLHTHRTITCLVFPTQGHRIHTYAQTHAKGLRHPPFFLLLCSGPEGEGAVTDWCQRTEWQSIQWGSGDVFQVTWGYLKKKKKRMLLVKQHSMFMIWNQEIKKQHLCPSCEKIKYRSYISLINLSSLTEKDHFKLHFWKVPRKLFNTICVFPLHAPTHLQLWL